ncbi:nuclear transport factor 2 family protein [Sphingomonas quercus]|uniref:Nuclear transport factor 2 family protein n=1 Tax=Sphingomonas quercus TaxID=2842451 RepID=A0ABS6BMI8_9SPHN|nr:nuclear transport factor 2 family protein [Sphingomonas quercus]MBU3078847.1 nuclear transport factor 2 family protein [Sphingomonas quercus]
MKAYTLAGIVVCGLIATGCSKPAAPPAPPAPAAAAAPTTEAAMRAAVDRHVTAVKAANVDGVMADYADDAVLVSPPGMVTPTGTFVGKQKVRDFFVWLSTPAVLPAAQSMESSSEMVGPDTLLFRWTQFPGTPKQVKGSDVFVFRDGKIVFQTTAALP